MKHITQYNSSKEPELHELIAVIKDLDDFKEVREFLTCCQRIALKCIETQNYAESMKICMLFACTLDHPKKIATLRSDPAALQELVKLLDLFALSLLETRQSLEQAETYKIIKALDKLKLELQGDPRLTTQVAYLTSVLREPDDQEIKDSMFMHELHDKYVEDLQELHQRRKNEEMESYRRVVFGTEYSTMMKGKTIENVISLAIYIVEKLEPKDMFGFLTYTDRANVTLPSGSLDHKLAYIRALEQFNQPKGDADFYAGLIGGLRELGRKRQHATAQLHFKHNDPVQSEFLVLVTTGQLLDASRETEALQTLYQYKGELMVVWLRAEKARCEEGFRRIQGALEQWSLEGGILTIIEAHDSDKVMTNPQVYQQLGLKLL
jgi:hypothetical protein